MKRSKREAAKLRRNARRAARSESVRPIARRVSLKTARLLVKEDRANGLRGSLVVESVTRGYNVVEVR